MQKTPPGMNRRRLVEAAAATAAVSTSTLGLPSLVLAEESSSMSAVAQPKGSEKTAIHPFHVNVPEAKQTQLRKRISATRWPERETRGRIARRATRDVPGTRVFLGRRPLCRSPQVQLSLATHASSLLVCRSKTGSKARR
jgi:hypothetical protein